jgi:hypothetical protein
MPDHHGELMHPFHTEEVDGVEVAGVLFDAKSGQFYEFQSPQDHDDWERFEDPRTGDVITNSSKIERMMSDILRGQPRATVPAEQWADFREDYAGADRKKFDQWKSDWERMAEKDPRFEGSANA